MTCPHLNLWRGQSDAIRSAVILTVPPETATGGSADVQEEAGGGRDLSPSQGPSVREQ